MSAAKAVHSPVFRALCIALWAAILFLPFKGIRGSFLMAAGVLLGLSLLAAAIKVWNFPAARKAAIYLPHSLKQSLAFRHTRSLFIALMVLIFISFPLLLNDYFLDVVVVAGIYVLLAQGLNVIVGFAGLLNLGYAAFYAIGAYTYALLNTRLGLGFWESLPLAAGSATLAGLLLAVPALRLRGDYLAIVTLGFGEIVRLVLNNWDSLTHGPNGITGIAPPSLWGLSLGKLNLYYYLVFFTVILSVVVITRTKYSRIGRAWIAIKENEIAASSMGINTTKYKVYAFAFGSFWAGIAGILFAAKMRFVSPESFTFMESVIILSMVILGGLGSVRGAVLGAFSLVILPEVLREVQLYRMLILGAGLVLLMIFRPQGLLGGIKGAGIRS